MTYFGPALDPPLGGSGRKTTTLVRDHEYFIPTKFHQNPSSGFGEEVENVKSLRTTDGRCAMTIAHSSLQLRWAKKSKFSKRHFTVTILSYTYFYIIFAFHILSLDFFSDLKNNTTYQLVLNLHRDCLDNTMALIYKIMTNGRSMPGQFQNNLIVTGKLRIMVTHTGNYLTL